MSPFALYAAGRRFHAPGWLVAAATIGLVLLLAGSRASWITFAVVLVLSGWGLLGGSDCWACSPSVRSRWR
jgi:hypothetical protein